MIGKKEPPTSTRTRDICTLEHREGTEEEKEQVKVVMAMKLMEQRTTSYCISMCVCSVYACVFGVWILVLDYN